MRRKLVAFVKKVKAETNETVSVVGETLSNYSKKAKMHPQPMKKMIFTAIFTRLIKLHKAVESEVLFILEKCSNLQPEGLSKKLFPRCLVVQQSSASLALKA